jgi:hypothetical protein
MSRRHLWSLETGLLIKENDSFFEGIYSWKEYIVKCRFWLCE